ncbi:transcription factor E2F6 [Parasteatoda tepidariorum]|uniref:transcription factor E2F6 n=1 Tax=Parasteatoda tepidariorum TaxID=114398 RepID=UPI00077F971D|nr:transcription factor E2F6 [Parasteatoda tepidariorum]
MSTTNSHNKSFSYHASIHKTPKLKENAACSSYDYTKDVPTHPQIVMDEYGQTPDHYYLAKKAPPSFYQAKRKLDLHTFGLSKKDSSNGNQRKLRKRGNSKNFEAKTADKPRYDTSLGQLTKKFLKLLAEANDGVINLNTACSLLSVPKRRLYDITNVLEGAGLIQKTSRNNIQWMGRVSSPCASLKKYELEREIDILEAKENKLDELIYHMKCEINSAKERDKKYHYITTDDIQSIEEFTNSLLIGVNMAPSVQVLESTERSIVVSSQSTEIETHYMCNDMSALVNLMLPNEIVHDSIKANTRTKADIFANRDKSKSIDSELSSGRTLNPCEDEENDSDPGIPIGSVWTECLDDDHVIRKNAFIRDDDDIAPIGKHFLLQTEDQDIDDFLPFSYLDDIDSYSFSLDVGEGLTDLYDCGFSCP